MRKVFLIFLLSLFIQHHFLFANDADKKKLDSINAFIDAAPKDTNLVNKLMYLSGGEYNVSSPELGLLYAKKALEIERQFDYKKRLGYVYRKLGNVYFDRFSNYSKALECYLESVRLYQQVNEKMGMADCYNNIGNIYTTKANFFQNTEEYNTALKYHSLALELREQNGSQFMIANSAYNIGTVFLSMHNYAKAIDYFLKAYEIYINGKEHPLLASMGLGEAYYRIGETQKALAYIFKCKEGYAASGSQIGLAGVYQLLGEIYLKSKEYAQSFDCLQKANYYAQNNNMKEAESQIDLLLSQLYNEQGDFKNAYKYQGQYMTIKDSLMNSQISKNIGLMQITYETDKKEKEINALKQEKEIQQLKLYQQDLLMNKRMIQMIAILLLILITVVLLYNRYRIKQKELFNKELLKEQELRSIAALEAEEKERTRIARDLHDGIGQLLSAIKINFYTLVKDFPKQDPEQPKLINNISQLVDESISDVRTISHNLVPSMFGRSKLDEAISEFVKKINTSGKIKINLEIIDLPEDLNGNLAVAIYRVIQEAINNIIKHAQATEVSIQIIRHDKELTLMIEDDGVGFDSSEINKFAGIGLKNMYSRIAYWKGKVNVDSRKGQGTTIDIQVPLE